MSVAVTRMTVEDAGAALGVSTATVWRMIRRGDLRSIREKGRRLVLAQGLRKARRPGTLNAIPPFTRDNPMFRLAGTGRSGGQKPDSSDKHAILAR